MGLFVFDLPWELRTPILNQLDAQDLLWLSSTCKHARDVLAPVAFESICFSNEERSCASALLAVQLYGQFTRRIKFLYRPTGASVRSSEATTEVDRKRATRSRGRRHHPVLRPAARQLLEGLYTPSLRSVEFDFDVNLGGDGRPYLREDKDLWDDGKDYGRFDSLERHLPWRALMNEAYLAVAENQTVSELILVNFPTLIVSAFTARPFQDLLARLRSASIHLLDYTTSPYPSSSRLRPGEWLDQYKFCIEDIFGKFFPYMSKLTHLTLHACPQVPLGGSRRPSVPLPLLPEQLPSLASLELGACFVGTKLMEFVRAHAHTLSGLVLRNCLVFRVHHNFWQALNQTWAVYLCQLYSLQFPLLSKFEIEFDLDKWSSPKSWRAQCELERAGKGQSGAVAAPWLERFAYLDSRQISEALFLDDAQREDEVAYKQLLKLAKSNAERIDHENRNK